MKKALKIILLILAGLLALITFLPLVIPVPPLENVHPARELADPDSQFVEINGLEVHYKIAGQGQPVMILLHGFGASTFSWNKVMPGLAQYGTVIAYDRPAFGLTERPMPGEWQGESPYSLSSQVSLLMGLMDQLGIEKAILIGHSAGGAVALQTALDNPARVQALVLVDAAVYGGGNRSGLLGFLFNTPQLQRLGPWFVRAIASSGEDTIRQAWHDPSRITTDVIAGYRKPLQVENWDRALWEFTLASKPGDMPSRLNEIQMPTLVLTGDDDRIVPTAQGLRLGKEIPGATLQVIPNCGHIPHEETPQLFMLALKQFFNWP
ncbi:MAG TPA: alpha/beta hydrolase [Anaerolineaceae bacterium]|nr:alpha/beta hydrolase [Anaerolineaceae bacterium]HPN50106.1 alpha/beta hydrolase [Anaerolineaceae bacterium]